MARARDEQAVRAFVERFAASMTDAGVPRMPSRVYAALLAADTGRLTAAELADRLQASPAAISGAVRYLTHVNMVTRGRDAGSRRDHFTVDGDTWQEALLDRDRVLARWTSDLRDGVAAVGPRTAAGRRMGETLAFLDFLTTELDGIMRRWRRHQKKQNG